MNTDHNIEIEKKVVEEIELLAKREVGNYDEVLFGQGHLLDSLNVLHILLFIESNFDVSIDTQELTIDNFNTINKIVNYVVCKIS